MKNYKSNLTFYFSKTASRRISKDKKLLNSLSKGLDVRGTIFLLKGYDSGSGQKITEFAKDISGFVAPYSGCILIVLSEILGCPDVSVARKSVVNMLEAEQLKYDYTEGEVLLGGFDDANSLVVGGVLNKLMVNLNK